MLDHGRYRSQISATCFQISLGETYGQLRRQMISGAPQHWHGIFLGERHHTRSVVPCVVLSPIKCDTAVENNWIVCILADGKMFTKFSWFWVLRSLPDFRLGQRLSPEVLRFCQEWRVTVVRICQEFCGSEPDTSLGGQMCIWTCGLYQENVFGRVKCPLFGKLFCCLFGYICWEVLGFCITSGSLAPEISTGGRCEGEPIQNRRNARDCLTRRRRWGRAMQRFWRGASVCEFLASCSTKVVLAPTTRQSLPSGSETISHARSGVDLCDYICELEIFLGRHFSWPPVWKVKHSFLRDIGSLSLLQQLIKRSSPKNLKTSSKKNPL